MKYETKRIKLVPFTKEHINLEWFIDPEVTKYNSWGLGPMSQKQEEEFLNSIDGKHKIVWAILETNSSTDWDIHIGNISLQSINYIYRSAEFAIIIGEKEYWGKGIGEEAGKLVLKHGFNRLNLNRIWTGTAITNIGMKKLAEKMGMKLEGHFKEGMFLSGRYQDICCYSILRKQWDKLNEKTNN